MTGLPSGTQGGGLGSCRQQDFGQYFTRGWDEMHPYETNTFDPPYGHLKRHLPITAS